MKTTEGRYIGGVRDKSAPTVGRINVLMCKIWHQRLVMSSLHQKMKQDH